MSTTRQSKAKQRLAAAGIAVGATLGSFAAVSALGSTDDSAAASSGVVANDDQSTDQTAGTPADGDQMPAEEPLTGDLADRVTAAAEAAVPGGTVERVETDAQGAAYEAHMTDADGNPVTVTFDEDLNVVETRTGMPGDHGGRGHHGRLDADDTGPDTATPDD
jgi:hypothetical protein